MLYMNPIFACTPMVGVVDTTDERVEVALWIFLAGLLLYFIHLFIYIYRSVKSKPRSGKVVLIFSILSLLIIPIVFMMVAMSAGMSCGFGSSYGPIFLVIFQAFGLLFQFDSRNNPITQDEDAKHVRIDGTSYGE